MGYGKPGLKADGYADLSMADLADHVGEHAATMAKTGHAHLSKTDAPAANMEVIGERRLRVSDRFDRLIGRFTPADVAKLKEKFLGVTAEAPNVMMLSKAEGEGDCAAAAVADFLLEYTPAPKTGTETPAQILSRADDQARRGSPRCQRSK